jgi:hypothetical protein
MNIYADEAPVAVLGLTGRGRVLLEGIDEARLRVERPLPSSAWMRRFILFFMRRSLRWNY